MAEIQRDKFIVIKTEDFLEAAKAAPHIKGAMTAIDNAVTSLRRRTGRTVMPQYIVCNQDEPYADRVWDVILGGEDSKEREAETIHK